MNLEEFREALSSEATIENDRLKNELENLKDSFYLKIKELEEEISNYKTSCDALSNRCYVYTRGMLCLSCEISSCEYFYNGDEMLKAARYMEKNHMPRTLDTYEKVNEFLMKTRKKRNKSK